MSTRSTTHFFDGGKKLCCFYRQCDGYPSGLGLELAEFLDGLTMTNGISGEKGKTANGMGCHAAQVVAHLKDGEGGVYMQPSSRAPDEEYAYYIKGDTYKPGALTVEVLEDGKRIFSGSVARFLQFCKDEK